jgi:hypothetical protein
MLLAPGQDEIAGHGGRLERHDDGGQEYRAPDQDQEQKDDSFYAVQEIAIGLSPSFPNKARSLSASGLGVVSSLGP